MTTQKKAIDYKDLLVWQKGITLVTLVYQITNEFPTDEKFGLISQLRRAAISIPSNIAEGQARHTTSQFIQFISHAEGSVAEVDTQLIIAMELGFCEQSELKEAFDLILELRKMLGALRRKLAQKRA